MSRWVDDRYCFACGEKNPVGMRLRFNLTEGGIETHYTFPKEFQGYADTAHGGMISLLLDEIMVNLPWQKYNVPVVSADIRVKLKRPLKTGVPVTARARFIKERKKVFVVGSEVIRDSDGALIAAGEAVCVKVDVEQLK